MRAEAAGDPGPWRQQAVLGRAHLNADALRDDVVEHPSSDDAVLVIDETGFLKQGKASCGVARQYTGSAGKTTNCQIGVFAAYVSNKGHAFIDRALYLPKIWTDDPVRMAAAHVPDKTAFATKPHLARTMIERTLEAGVPYRGPSRTASRPPKMNSASTTTRPARGMAGTVMSRSSCWLLP